MGMNHSRRCVGISTQRVGSGGGWRVEAARSTMSRCGEDVSKTRDDEFVSRDRPARVIICDSRRVETAGNRVHRVYIRRFFNSSAFRQVPIVRENQREDRPEGDLDC
jgi:hypothetical protein